MIENTIKIIEAVGNQWEFLLIVFIIIVVLIKWKTIWELVSTLTQIRIKKGNTEIELHKDSKDSKDSKDKEKRSSSIVIPVNEINNNVLKTEEQNTTIEQEYFDSIFDRKFSDSKIALEKIISKENDSKKKNILKIRDFYRRHQFGDSTAFEAFEDYKNNVEIDNESKSITLFYLSKIYNESNDYDKSLELLNKALELTNQEEQKVNCIIEISLRYIENQETKKAIDLLCVNIDNTTNRKNKASLYKAIAEFYKKTENKLLESVAYQKALELNPNNTSLLFDSAYNYSNSESGLDDLGLLLYLKILKGNPNHKSALNNIGVIYRNLNLNFKSVDFYKRGIKNNETLSASNLSYLLIDRGFRNEALEYLNNAKSQDEVDDNVYKALDYLKSNFKKEKDLENEILKKANKKFKFFSGFGAAAFSNQNGEVKGDNWIVNDNPVSVNAKEKLLRISWSDLKSTEHSLEHKIEGSIINNAILVNYMQPEINPYSYSEESKFRHGNYKGHGYFNRDGNIEFIFEIKNELVEILISKA